MMAENSGISWTDHTFNPWMGCTKVSPACKNCYAERDFDHRYGKVKWGPSGTRVITSDANWNKPLKWNKEAAYEHAGRIGPTQRPRVFCASLADVFEDWDGPIADHHGDQLFFQASGDWRNVLPASMAANRTGSTAVTMEDVRKRLFELIDATPNLDWLLLTKRPENVRRMWPWGWGTAETFESIPQDIPGAFSKEMIDKGSPMRQNVWLGTSIENQEYAEIRLPHLHDAKRRGLVEATFVSAEPLVGPVILQGNCDGKVYNHLGDGGIDWVITGGESGPGARAVHPDWFRSLRDQCDAAGTAFHFKQWGEWVEAAIESPADHAAMKGREWTWFDRNGKSGFAFGTEGRACMVRVGKKVAGRSLDGVEHNAFPSPERAA